MTSGAVAATAVASPRHAFPPVRVGFVLHVMQVAGAEVLVAEIIRRLGPAIDPVVLCLDGVGAIGQRLQNEGVPVIDLKRRPGLDLPLVRRFAAAVEEHRLEVVHAHQYTPFFYAALARLLVRHRLHVILTEHGRHYPDVVTSRRRLVNRLLLSRLAEDITGVCEFSIRGLSANDGFPASRALVIENGIDPDRYGSDAPLDVVRRRVGLSPDRSYIACVARFHPVKDHDTLVRAFAQFAERNGHVDLVLVGDGPRRPHLERLCGELGIAGRVIFTGVRSDVADLLRACDVFAMTSLSEAASLTVLEAMAAGRPVLVTEVGGNPELVRHGRDGLLVPRGDVAAAAGALQRLFHNPEDAARMGASARRRVRETFRLDTTVWKYYERYRAGAERIRRDREN